MTPTESEKQAALAWADRLEAVKGTFAMVDGHGGNPGILAACLRAAEAENKAWMDGSEERRKHLEMMSAERRAFWDRAEKAEAELAALRLKPDGNHDRCNAGMRSRLKTLEEENARMRDLVNACREAHDLPDEVERKVWAYNAALKQEAE